MRHRFGYQEIHQNASTDDQQIAFVEIAVKPERHPYQKQVGDPVQFKMAESIIPCQCDRQK